jgi:diguanylate cyclase (GGDEF)-like protein
MTLELWRLSTAVQVASLVLIATFFAAYARQARTAEGWAWRDAWLANLIALAVTVVFWVLQPSGATFGVLAGSYMGAKLAFVAFLARGTWAIARPGTPLPGWRVVLAACAAWGIGSALVVRDIATLGLAQHALMTVAFAAPLVLVWRGDRGFLGWLGAGIVARAALSAVAAGAYAIDGGLVATPAWTTLDGTRFFLAAHSAVDAGAEWLLALGMVYAMTARARRELEATNDDLLAAQASLRALADRDALTGFPNRRALAAALRAAQPGGATIAFLDLDGFKQVNDLHGHAVGDQVLVRFASALRDSFRPEDTVVRHGGDEFVVVAPGLDAARTQERLFALRARLEALRGEAPRIRFSAGTATLDAGGWPDEALAAADAAMYAAKRRGGQTPA